MLIELISIKESLIAIETGQEMKVYGSESRMSLTCDDQVQVRRRCVSWLLITSIKKQVNHSITFLINLHKRGKTTLFVYFMCFLFYSFNFCIDIKRFKITFRINLHKRGLITSISKFIYVHFFTFAFKTRITKLIPNNL